MLEEEEAVMKAKKKNAAKKTGVATTARGVDGGFEALAIAAPAEEIGQGEDQVVQLRES